MENQENPQKPNLSHYYKGRTLTRKEILSLYNDKSFSCTIEDLGIKYPIEEIPFRSYLDPSYNGNKCLLHYDGCCYIYEIRKLNHLSAYLLEEIIRIKGEYKENVMIFTKSSIGRILYGTMESNTPESITLTNCVEIDFSRNVLYNNNLGYFSSSVRYLKDCFISPVIAELTSFEVIFVFSCSEEVKEYLDSRIANNTNEIDKEILRDLCRQK